ncbi:hypothetical protein B0T17DRAFT_652956 [Bombardia bombarda]|uniref:Uncharacterized protein n=1 Tax=Bombardia bombarda TaxID=252184 RepID=A0AA39X8H1_9PEZI|nr:hypothetical protein B0T17DRAFT_652956 [Bombardia bombarda]
MAAITDVFDDVETQWNFKPELCMGAYKIETASRPEKSTGNTAALLAKNHAADPGKKKKTKPLVLSGEPQAMQRRCLRLWFIFAAQGSADIVGLDGSRLYRKLLAGTLLRVPTIQDRFSGTGRGYPTLALRADNYPIVTNRQWIQVSATSASNPVFDSMITLINSERMHAGKGPVSFINSALYANPDVLSDVVTGAN